MTLKNNRAPLPCYFKLCTSFQSHGWIQTGVTLQNRLIRVEISHFLSHVTIKFEGWPSKMIGHLFYNASSFEHHFVAISESKLDLKSGNAFFFLVKIDDSFSCVTLKFDRWPWKTFGQLSSATSSFGQNFIIIFEFKLELWSGNIDLCYLDFWPLTFCMDLTFVIGNTSWKFHDDTMTRTLWTGVIDRQTHTQTDGLKCS